MNEIVTAIGIVAALIGAVASALMAYAGHAVSKADANIVLLKKVKQQLGKRTGQGKADEPWPIEDEVIEVRLAAGLMSQCRMKWGLGLLIVAFGLLMLQGILHLFWS